MNTEEMIPATGVTPRVLTDQMIAEIRAFFPRYPSRQAVTLPALHVVHERLRHVSPQAVVEIADLLGLAPSQVQDTLTFYGFFKQDAPHGRLRIWICRSISCHLRGADELLEYVCQRTGIAPGEVTPDGGLTVEFAECLGACELAPCALAGDTIEACLTKEKLDELLALWQRNGAERG
ncbi:MAG: NADH-quinone oxidoreductase subunit NuoE family protein [Pirellulaceae bacterium]